MEIQHAGKQNFLEKLDLRIRLGLEWPLLAIKRPIIENTDWNSAYLYIWVILDHELRNNRGLKNFSVVVVVLLLLVGDS